MTSCHPQGFWRRKGSKGREKGGGRGKKKNMKQRRNRGERRGEWEGDKEKQVSTPHTINDLWSWVWTGNQWWWQCCHCCCYHTTVNTSVQASHKCVFQMMTATAAATATTRVVMAPLPLVLPHLHIPYTNWTISDLRWWAYYQVKTQQSWWFQYVFWMALAYFTYTSHPPY